MSNNSLPLAARVCPGRCPLLVALLALGLAARAEAQVGLTSGIAQVGLIARAPLQGTIEGLETHGGIGLSSSQGNESITLRLSSNSGYRLIVRGSGVRSEELRIWFRSVAGELEEITDGSAVVVADGSKTTGITERKVEYRVEGVTKDSEPLPVYYELQVSPSL
jgi:hypothetical protein